MKRIPTTYLILLPLSILALRAGAQTSRIDSVRNEIQGAWRMNADTNMVLVFYADSMVHRMIRTSGVGRARYTITDKNCDTARFIKENALYLLETYRYYRQKIPLIGELCSKIVHLENGVLILKRDKIYETYTKLRAIPPPHQ